MHTFSAIIHKDKMVTFDGEEPSRNGNGMNATAKAGTMNRLPLPLTFGHTASAVLLWMGQQSWEFGQARAMRSQLKVEVADHSIRSQLSAGRTGRLPAHRLSREDFPASRAAETDPERHLGESAALRARGGISVTARMILSGDRTPRQ
jgi:hypothetical protein